MFERFTESAIKVIMLAQEESRRLGHNFVGTEQILLGLIGEENGVAAKSLKECGLTLAAARAEVETIIGRGSSRISVQIPFTPRARRVLELAWREARLLGDDYISNQHLLLGILREGAGVANQILDNLKVDRKLRVLVLEAMGKVDCDESHSPVLPEDTSTIIADGGYFWLDENSKAVIEHAREIAETFGASVIEEEHLCLALLRDSDLMRCVKSAAEISLSELRRKLISKLQYGDAAPSKSMKFSPSVRAILANAWRLSEERKSYWVTRETILFGAFQHEDGVFSSVMRSANSDPLAISKSLLESIEASRDDDSLDKAESSPAISPTDKDAWSTGGWFITLVVSALLIYAIYLTDYEKFVLMAPVLLLTCFVIFAVLLFRKAVLK